MDIISIYIKEQRFLSLCANSSWTDEHIWTNDTSLEPAWHVDGFFRSKISVPTAMEWPETQTCPKSSRSAIISETMRRIEILRALYVIQLLLFVSGGWNPPDAKTRFNAFRRSIWSPECFCRFFFGSKNPAGAQYNSWKVTRCILTAARRSRSAAAV